MTSNTLWWRVFAVTTLTAISVSGAAGDRAAQGLSRSEIRRSVDTAATYAADRLLGADGRARGDYDITTARWTEYEPAWHTGQLVAGMLGAYDVLGHERYLERAIDGAEYFIGLRIEDPPALRGMLRTWHDENNPNITMTTLSDGAAPIFDVYRRIGDQRILEALRDAGDWMIGLYIPERRLFFDVINPDGRVMGRDFPMDPSINKDDARYGTEGSFFAHLYRATKDEKYLRYFLEPAQRMVADQQNGVWPQFRPNDPDSGSLHGRFNLWYAEAMLEAYDLTGEKKFLEAALATARTYAAFPDPDGTLYYRHRLDGWRSVSSPSGSVVAFTGILWLRLSQLGYHEFDPLIERAVDWLLANQYPSDHPDPNLAGGYFELWTKVHEGDFRVFHRDIATAFGLRFLTDYLKTEARNREPDP
jgi:hypothetical protein